MGKRQLLLFLAIAITTLSLALLISACSKSSSSPTGPGGAGGVVTVTGKVIGINNQPVASVPVLITGLPSVNTDANGSFTIPNVTTPYSIAVVDGVNNRALVYRGLTRSDPTLVWLGASPGTPRNASVSGSLIPWTAIAPGAKTNARVAFVSTDATGVGLPSFTTGAFSSGTLWYGPTTTTGSLYALVWDYDANGLPTTFSKYGKRANVTLLDGTTNANQNDTLGVAQTAQISGTMNVAAGYTLSTRSLTAVFESKGGITFASEVSPVPNFTYNTPNIPGVTLSLVALATKAGSGTVESFTSGLAVNATNVSVNVPAAPELSLPVNNATGVTTGTPFSWTQFSGGVHIVSFSPAVAGQPSVLVVTAATGDSIPNLSSAGLALPKSASYSWSVIGVSPFASIDAAAGTGGVLGFATSTSSFTGSFGNSSSRTFTTAP